MYLVNTPPYSIPPFYKSSCTTLFIQCTILLLVQCSTPFPLPYLLSLKHCFVSMVISLLCFLWSWKGPSFLCSHNFISFYIHYNIHSNWLMKFCKNICTPLFFLINQIGYLSFIYFVSPSNHPQPMTCNIPNPSPIWGGRVWCS